MINLENLLVAQAVACRVLLQARDKVIANPGSQVALEEVQSSRTAYRLAGQAISTHHVEMWNGIGLTTK